MTREELMDVIAIAQSCPGVFAINVSTFVGYRLRKTRGAVCTTLGTALPSFIIILLIAMFFRRFQDNTIVAAMFRGIRPAVVALIAVPTFNMAQRTDKRHQLLDSDSVGTRNMGTRRVADSRHHHSRNRRMDIRQIHLPD